MPGFVRVMDAVDEAWRERRADLLEQAGTLHDAIARSTEVPSRDPGDPSADVLGVAVAADQRAVRPALRRLRERAEVPAGDDARVPPLPSGARRRRRRRSRRSRCRSTRWRPAACTTRSAAGSTATRSTRTGSSPTSRRCSTTRRCSPVPTCTAGSWSGSRATAAIVEEIVEYVLRDLRHADGGFFSAEDADSEGVEGKFYLWSLEEIEALCGADTARGGPLLRCHRGRQLRRPAHRATAATSCTWSTVRRTDPKRSAASCPGCSRRATRVCVPGSTTRCCSGGTRCSSGRSPRPRSRSGVTTGWTPRARTRGSSCASCGATTAASCGRGRADAPTCSPTPRTTPRCSRRSLTLAEVDDVAWLADAQVVADDLVRLFADDENGGVFTTGVDAESLIVRPKDYQDNATPSENSLAADGLLRLAALTGDAALRGPRVAVDPHDGTPARRAPHRVRLPARGVRAARHAAHRGRGRRSARRSRHRVAPGRAPAPADPGVGAGHGGARHGRRPHAAPRRPRPRRRQRHRLRVRALRLPSPRHRSGRSSSSTAGLDAPETATRAGPLGATRCELDRGSL